MNIKISQIKELLVNAASKVVNIEEAEYFAQEQIECLLRMLPDVNTLEEAISDIENWKNSPEKKFTILSDKMGTLSIDFNKLSPTLKLKYLHGELEKRAKENGISMLGINNSSVPVWLKLMTSGLAKRNLIAIYMVNGGGGSAVPFGGTTPIFGTNPLSYAIPTDTDPIVVDMATSESAFYKYNRARKSQTLMENITFADENGVPTNDPTKAYINDDNARILPMGGGYRGYNIIFLVEVLTGALVRSKMGLQKSDKYTPIEYGSLLLVIDIDSLTSIESFKHSVSEMCASIRSQKPATNVDAVKAPGDSSLNRLNNYLKIGSIDIDEEIIKKLNNL